MVHSTRSIFIFSLLCLCVFSNAKNASKPTAFIFPIRKEATTNQYYTTIEIGSESTAFNVGIDLGGKFLWFNSVDYYAAAYSYRPILCDTPQCHIADGVGCIFCVSEPPLPDCNNNTCSDFALNPFSGMQVYSGLGQDVLRLHSTSGSRYNLSDFPFQYSMQELREGLASNTAGLLGLGRNRISLQAQVASKFKIRQKFALCIPSSRHTGSMIIGQGVYDNRFQEISKSLISTPLIRNPVSTIGNEQIGIFSVDYFIDVKSIRVDNKILSFNNSLLKIDTNTGDGGTSLRTVKHYTGLRTSIFRALVNEFVKAAASRNITRVASVAPFGACFDARTVSRGKTGPQVPTIDLVLRSKSLYWRFYGSNSMVRVRDNTICLAFVEEQLNPVSPITSIAVGGYQMENHLLEFDVSSSRLGISRSLLLHDTSCSKFRAS